MAITDYIAANGRYLRENGDTVNFADINAATLGQLGGKYISTTDATTPASGFVFVAVQVITDCSITLVAESGSITGITTVSVAAGTILYGRYTSCTLASGSVIAYNGV